MHPHKTIFADCVVAVVALLSAFGCNVQSEPQGPPVTVEFRPAVETPGDGLKEFVDPFSGKPIYIRDEVVLGNEDIRDAKAHNTGDSGWAITLFIEDEAAARFEETTQGLLGKKIAIFLDDTLVSAPTIQSPISSTVMIVGDFTKEETARLVDGIRAGRVER
jgi:preprotein translocase subunit SecD